MTFDPQLEKFYEEDFFFSYSGINKLLFSPGVFYNHYVLKEREDSVDAHLVAGRALHCMLLENDTFSDQFLITPGKIPTGNSRIIVDACYKAFENQPDTDLELTDFEQVILDTLLSLDLHQKLKTDEQRVEKMTIDLNKDYFKYLKSRNGKALIGQEMYDDCKTSLEYLKANDKVTSLLQSGVKSTLEFKVLNEQLLQMDLDTHTFGLKGIVDNIVIDYINKRVFVNDLKTTGKSIQDFDKSVEFYNYWIQAVIYKKLTIANYLKNQADIEDWTVHVTFIVIDKFNQVYPFQVSAKTLTKWEAQFEDILVEIDYHYTNKDYTLPYKLAQGNFKL